MINLFFFLAFFFCYFPVSSNPEVNHGLRKILTHKNIIDQPQKTSYLKFSLADPE